MQVLSTTTNRLHLVSILLMFVSHLCHLVGIFLLTSFLQTSRCVNYPKSKFWLSRSIVQVWRRIRGHYHYPRSPKYIIAPSTPSFCYPDTSLSFGMPMEQELQGQKKVTCPILLSLGLGHNSPEAEKAAVSLVTEHSPCERVYLLFMMEGWTLECTLSTHSAKETFS